jgi:hypothetical protein
MHYLSPIPSVCTQGAYLKGGVQAVILSDKLAGPERMPLPSLLTVGAVHQHLLVTKQRPKAALFLECGDAREVHDFAALLGFGADGVCPYLAYETLACMNENGTVFSRANLNFTNEDLFYSYRNAAAKGILKVSLLSLLLHCVFVIWFIGSFVCLFLIRCLFHSLFRSFFTLCLIIFHSPSIRHSKTTPPTIHPLFTTPPL